jgi:hypothetical protein
MAVTDGLRQALETIEWPPADQDAVAAELGLEPKYSPHTGERTGWFLAAPRRWTAGEGVVDALVMDHGAVELLEARRRLLLVPKAPENETVRVRKLPEPVATAAQADYLFTVDVRWARAVLAAGRAHELVHRLDWQVSLVRDNGTLVAKAHPEPATLLARWETPLLLNTQRLLAVGAQLALFDAPGASA